MERRDSAILYVPGKSYKQYQAIHIKSEYGDYPLCHLRPKDPNIVLKIEEADCRHCLRIIKEYES